MPKKIESYKDLNILLRADRGVFAVNLRPIGGGQPTFNTKAEAVAHAKDLFDRYRGNKPVKVVSAWTIYDAFAAFKNHLEAKVQDPDVKYGSGSQGNQEAHMRYISGLKFDGLLFAKVKVASLTKKFIEGQFWPELRRHGAKSGITALNRFNTFAQVLEHCLVEDQIEVNVAHTAKIEKPDRHSRWKETTEDGAAKVDFETLQKILDHVLPKHKLKVLFALQTGLRVGEQLALKVYDPKNPLEGGMDFKTHQVFVRTAVKRTKKHADAFIGKPKSEKGIRTLSVTPALSAMLEEEYKNLPDFRKAEGWVFPSEHGTRCLNCHWRVRILYRAYEATGLPRKHRPTWHSLRHAYATALLTKRGGDFIRCMELMGHADMKTTLIYKHIVHDPERNQAEAAAVASGQGLTINAPEGDGPGSNVVPLKRKAA